MQVKGITARSKEQSAIHSVFIKLPTVITNFVCLVLSGRCTQGLLNVNNDMLVVFFRSSGCSKIHRHSSKLIRLCTNCLFQDKKATSRSLARA